MRKLILFAFAFVTITISSASVRAEDPAEAFIRDALASTRRLIEETSRRETTGYRQASERLGRLAWYARNKNGSAAKRPPASY